MASSSVVSVGRSSSSAPRARRTRRRQRHPVARARAGARRAAPGRGRSRPRIRRSVVRVMMRDVEARALASLRSAKSASWPTKSSSVIVPTPVEYDDRHLGADLGAVSRRRGPGSAPGPRARRSPGLSALTTKPASSSCGRRLDPVEADDARDGLASATPVETISVTVSPARELRSRRRARCSITLPARRPSATDRSVDRRSRSRRRSSLPSRLRSGQAGDVGHLDGARARG